MNDDIRQKIAALLRLARSRAASEAEAMAAAERAARLMREYGIDPLDVEFDEKDAPIKTRGQSPRDRLWGMIAVCTNCAAVLRQDYDPAITYIGRAPGPDIAVYLVAVLSRAIDHEVEAFKQTPAYKRRRTLTTRRAAVQDFTVGFISRIRGRLSDMFAETISDEERASARKICDLRISGQTPLALRDHKVRFGSAAGAGYSAAGRINLTHGVNGVQAPRQIGGA